MIITLRLHHTLFCVITVLLLAGCGSRQTTLIEGGNTAYKSSSMSVVRDDGRRGVPIDDEQRQTFELTLKRLLLRKGFAEGGGMSLRYWFSELDEGSQTARYFSLGIGGTGKVKVFVEFYDARGNKLALTDNVGTVRGGFFGGSYTKALENAAESIADYARKNFYSKNALVTAPVKNHANTSAPPPAGVVTMPVAPVTSHAHLTPDPGLKTWQMAINTHPSGALIKAYDSNQNLYQIGKSPTSFLWPLQTQADTLVIVWQGRHLSVLPTFMESITVDFSQQPPVVKGATVIASAQPK